MGRTVPSFRIVISEEKKEWKPFRNALDKKFIFLSDKMSDKWEDTALALLPEFVLQLIKMSSNQYSSCTTGSSGPGGS